ncbi:MAG: Nudix family hydrolase [Casimicrobiaceae bacterium]
MSEAEVVRVAVAVLLRDGKVLLAQRLKGTPYAGYWEFPGGKLEAGETPRQALVRELGEELGIRVTQAVPWLTQRYTYPHADVKLDFFRVFDWDGELHGRDGQAIAWQIPGAFDVEPLLPANTVVLRALLLPAVYGISMAEDQGEVAFLAAAEVALDRGLRLIQLREKSFSVPRLVQLATDLLRIAHSRGARVLLNGDAALAQRLGCDGVHWPATTLLGARERPGGMLCAASTHNAAELACAAELGLDFAVLGPVSTTPSHPGASTLGWERFAALAAGSPIPVYALGGLAVSDLATAQAHGAHGVALRRAAFDAA